MTLDGDAQDLLRTLAPQVLGILRRRYRDFAGCEDAVQEALIAALRQWPREGRPDNPRGWLLRVATRRLADEVRADAARRHREEIVVSLVPADEQIALAADRMPSNARDETLDLYVMCCHPALTTSSQVALTLRAVGGLTTAEIARAFFVPETTMAQRISRAKQAIRQSGTGFAEPGEAQRRLRLTAVLRVLAVIFGEGYAASEGALPVRIDLTTEALRVTRLLVASVPEDAEAAALLALMLLTDARRPARVGPLGELVSLDEQDRTAWNRDAVAAGTAWLETAIGLARGRPGPYLLQAAVAALHDEAPDIDATDWRQIRALYARLITVADSPMARLSHAIATAMVEGPDAGLSALADLARDPVLAASHRLPAARAHLLERAGRRAEAAEAYRAAAGGTASTAERTYLLLRAARLTT
ncbi:MAG: RNA polymerase sigma factor [Vicinamibacterales bacterium]